MNRLRKGYTLVELLAVLAVFSVILGTAMLGLQATYRTNNLMRDNLEHLAQRQRLSDQLRSDAHQALDVELVPGDQSPGVSTGLRLALPDDLSIEYQLQAERVQRLVRSGNEVQQRESYRVEPVLDKGWIVDRQRQRPLVSLYVQQRPHSTGDGLHGLAPLRLDAAIHVVPPARDGSTPRG